MHSGTVFPSAIIGTTAMTLFNYSVSEVEHRNFREPAVLRQLVKRLPVNISTIFSGIAGWIGHYAIGILFVIFYNELWKRKIINSSVLSGIFLGAISGLAGIHAWQMMFKIHPNPNLKRYFRHLIHAHIVFSVFSALTYKYKSSDKNSSLP